jgi:hypothetical protein
MTADTNVNLFHRTQYSLSNHLAFRSSERAAASWPESRNPVVKSHLSMHSSLTIGYSSDPEQFDIPSPAGLSCSLCVPKTSGTLHHLGGENTLDFAQPRPRSIMISRTPQAPLMRRRERCDCNGGQYMIP